MCIRDRANDPHRSLSNPSLRYMAHLVAPGWNVIGGGEPEIPGISIGHNGIGAWGLTVFRTDAEDLYVYKLNPSNLNEYMHDGQWKRFKKINESIKNRDFWMPFALTILKEKHRKFIKNSKNFRADFMTMTFDTIEKNVSQISAGCHPYDKTVRPQILEKKFNPQYLSLIHISEPTRPY